MAELTVDMLRKAKRIIAEQDQREQDEFSASVFKPPHLARLLDICGEFTGRLNRSDRESFLNIALRMFFHMRHSIHVANDIPKTWVVALEEVAAIRPRWQIWNSVDWVWVKPHQLRRKG